MQQLLVVGLFGLAVVLAVYAAEVALATRDPMSGLRMLVPWGGARRVSIHPNRLEQMEADEAADEYRSSGRGSAVGHAVRLVRESVAVRRGKPERPSILQPGPDDRALLVVHESWGYVAHRFVFDTRVVDNGGVAEIRTYKSLRIAPFLGLCLFVVLLVMRGGHLPIGATLAFAIGLVAVARGIWAASADAAWVQHELEARLARAPVSRRPKSERTPAGASMVSS